MPAYLQSVLDWITLNPHWSILAVFLVSFAESLAVVGVIVPGVAIMFAVGAMIAADILPFLPTCAAAAIGAILGDSTSFWIGRHYRDSLYARWPFSRHPRMLERGVEFFARYGGKSIAFGRFVGPVRGTLPMVAGMLQMPAKRFLVVEILSGLAWAPAYLLPGLLVGASLELASEIATRLVLLLLTLGISLWLVSWMIRRSFGWLQPRAACIMAWMLSPHRGGKWAGRLTSALADPNHPEARGLATLAILLVVATAAFAALLNGVMRGELLGWIDQGMYEAFSSLRTPVADKAMIAITHLGGTAEFLLLSTVVLIWLLLRQNGQAAWHWLAATGFALAAGNGLKILLQVPRPGVIDGIAHWSFPSGHTLQAVCAFGFLAVLVASGLRPHLRWLPYMVAALLSVSVGISRLYLGAHWLSDVLASLCLGTAWVGLLGIAFSRHRTNPINSIALTVIATSALAAAAALNLRQNLDADLVRYSITPDQVVISEADWVEGGWQSMPRERDDLFELAHHPFTVQWSQDPDAIAAILEKDGWRPADSGARALLELLLRSTDRADELPVLPQVNDGQHELLRLRRNDPDNGNVEVLRLWATPYRLEGSGDTLLIGNVSRLAVATAGHVIYYLRTDPGSFDPELQNLVAETLKDPSLAVTRHENVVLIRPVD